MFARAVRVEKLKWIYLMAASIVASVRIIKGALQKWVSTLIVLFVVTTLSGCKPLCWGRPVETREQAFDILQALVQSRHPEELTNRGVEVDSFFSKALARLPDYSNDDSFNPCKRPKNWTQLTSTNEPDGSFSFTIGETRKGNCADCWEYVSVSASMSRCGNIQGYLRFKAEPRFARCSPL